MSTLDVREQRLAMTDALMPPSGYRLGAAIGTAYSLDFDALTAVLLAFSGADGEDEPARIGATLTSLARMRNRLRVLVDGAGIHAGKPHRLYALFDRVIRPVSFAGAAFHPKVWALRFDPMQRPARNQPQELFRVLVTSRNLTDSRCWELATVVNGRARGKASHFGGDVAGFLKQVAGGRDLPAECWKLVEGLKLAEFDEAREWSVGLRLRWQHPKTDGLAKVLPKRARRALVISPFVRAEFVNCMVDRFEDLTFVSTQEELDALPEAAHTLLEPVKVLVVTDAFAADLPALDLHAKLVAWEVDGERETLLGSANATAPGWGLSGRSNAEAMISMKPGPSIAELVKAFVSPSRGEYYAWIEEYRRGPLQPDEIEETKRRLDRVKRAICLDRIRVSYEPQANTMTVRAAGGWPAPTIPEGVDVAVTPLLGDRGEWCPYSSLRESGASFGDMGWDSVSAFLRVRLTDTASEHVEFFCLQAVLDISATQLDERDREVNARLLEGLDVRTLLLNVLEGLPAGSGLGKKDHPPTRGTGGGRFLRQATIERVMEACTADPGRVDEIDAVLRAAEGTEAFRGFTEFWTEFRAALDEVKGHV